MGLFGGMRRGFDGGATAPIALPQMLGGGKVGGNRAVGSSRGLFGAGWRKNLPQILSTVGAGLQQMDGGNELTEFLAQQEEQMRRQRDEYRQARDDKMEEGQRADLNQARDTFMEGFTPEQRAQFQLFPESFAPMSSEDAAVLGIRQQDAERQRAQFEETMRHNRASEGIDYMRASREDRQGMPSLSEARQWTNSYNDDTRTTLGDLGNMRAALPYATSVVRARGQPEGNFRMNDVALLRAAARAQTGPGVLTEGEVFGTLSPSLQQDLVRARSYADIAQAGLRPQDRLALAQYVQEAQRNASGDLWRRYQDAESVLSARGVSPENVGISSPEYVHPEDMDSFMSVPLERYRAGHRYVSPAGRTYEYIGHGRFRYVGREQYDRDRSIDRTRQHAGDGVTIDLNQ